MLCGHTIYYLRHSHYAFRDRVHLRDSSIRIWGGGLAHGSCRLDQQNVVATVGEKICLTSEKSAPKKSEDEAGSCAGGCQARKRLVNTVSPATFTHLHQ